MTTTQLPEPQRLTQLVDELLTTILDWQLDLAIPDSELDEHLSMYGRLGDACAADMFREARWTLWSVIRTLEALSATLHDRQDPF
jgi:hypothetical protein